MHGSDRDTWHAGELGTDDDARVTAGTDTGWRLCRRGGTIGVGLLGLTTLAVQPAVAQSMGQAFCDTPLVQTLGNLLTVIQMGGPLLGGIVALGATVSMPMVRRTDIKREIKTARNQGLIWGVIVAPLATTIIKFLLQHVVVGASSCGF